MPETQPSVKEQVVKAGVGVAMGQNRQQLRQRPAGDGDAYRLVEP
jgi:hypothetical protein